MIKSRLYTLVGDYPDRRYLAVLRNGWLSGSSHVYLHEGDAVTRREGGFFGRLVSYTLIEVEARLEGPSRLPFPVLVVKDEKGKIVLIEDTHNCRTSMNADTAPASSVRDGWVIEYTGG